MHHCNSTQYGSTETVFIYIPFSPHQHHISDVANWRQLVHDVAIVTMADLWSIELRQFQ